MFPKLYKLSVNLAEKINIPHHSDNHCRCMGSMISSTSDIDKRTQIMNLILLLQFMSCIEFNTTL